MQSAKPLDLVPQALDLDKFSIARLITLCEDERPSAPGERAAVLGKIAADKRARQAYFVGLTGTPGAGKSTLVGELAKRLVGKDQSTRVAVLAIDPTSHISGGSLLGDRTRVNFPVDEPRLFFRSQPSRLDLGGLGRGSFQVCRLLRHLFDIVFIETVGIGQSEIDVKFLSDRAYLVLQPLGGDEVQFMKAGIMEIPDAFILNKCDSPEAQKSYFALRGTLHLARPDRPGEEAPIHKTSAVTGEGLDRLTQEIYDKAKAGAADFAPKEAFFFGKWVDEEYGQRGRRFLEGVGGPTNYLQKHGGFDAAQAAFHIEFIAELTQN